MIKNVMNYDYVSFDIFDTLIKRNVSNSQAIFEMVEKRYNQLYDNKISNFKTKRITAENNSRANKLLSNEEVTLDQIYEQLLEFYDNKIVAILKELEIEIEIDFCQKNNDPKITELYEWATKNRKAIIVSDIYLPRYVIEKILFNSGIKDYKALFISSEVMKTKSSGNLFKYVIDKLNIDSKKVIHIGDNKKSDYINAKKSGIDAILYKSKKSKNIINQEDISIVNRFIQNNITKDNYYYNFGYKNLGPLLFGYSEWLYKNCKDKKLYFLSRDGLIMKKAFDIMYPKSKTEYIYASRRALIVPSFYNVKKPKEIFSKMNLPKEIKLIDLLERLGNDIFNINEIYNKYNLEVNKKYNLAKLIKSEKFEKLMNDYFDLIIENSKIEYKSMKAYFNKIGLNNNSNIVDIGWYGSMQKALIDSLNIKINGYYLGIHTKENNISDDKKGFLFDKDKNLKMSKDEYLYNSILEFVFSTNHGSAKKFYKNGEVELYDYEFKNEVEEEILDSIQKGALDFISAFSESNIKKYILFNEYNSSYNFIQNVLYPSYNDSIKLGSLRIKDNGINYIAKPKGLLFYLIHPKDLKRDFSESTWKIGFLKKLFKVKLPYYEIIKYLKSKQEVQNGK